MLDLVGDNRLIPWTFGRFYEQAAKWLPSESDPRCEGCVACVPRSFAPPPNLETANAQNPRHFFIFTNSCGELTKLSDNEATALVLRAHQCYKLGSFLTDQRGEVRSMRCTRCVLPDQVPGSDFDEAGICIWCREGYPNYKPRGREALGPHIRQRMRSESGADCVVGISGGKDSSFAVWAMKKHFGLRVHAFTYDHDGVLPFARDNAKAVCESLGVPLTVASLGPEVHLQSFRDYFSAWIEHPSAVSAGMTCVACKHLHLFGTGLAAKLNAPMVIWANCPLENSPFLALKYRGRGAARDGLLKGAALLAREALSSPELLRAIALHFPMTFQGCLAFSPSSPFLKWRFPSVEQLLLFDYWPWNPSEIYSTLSRETAWKKPEDCPNDWHSDCTFNIFKEYLFQSMLGVSYTDGFLSNQIRAGILTRDKALRELAESKRYFATALGEALRRVGLEHLSNRIDGSCFAIRE